MPGGAIRFTHAPTDPAPADVTVVLDTTWTAPVGTESPDEPSRLVSVRDVAAAVLAEHDLIAETSTLLDDWVGASGVIELLTIRDTSFWYYVRLRHWVWLEERVLWAAIADRILREQAAARIVCAPGTDAALLEVLRLVAARDGIELLEEPEPEPEPAPDAAAARSGLRAPGRPAPAAPASRAGPAAVMTAAGSATQPARSGAPSTTARRPRTGLRHSRPGRLARRLRNLLLGPPPPTPSVIRQQLVQTRLDRVHALVDALAGEPEARLLVVHEHARQRVDTPSGPRSMNPYLDPIVDRLRGTRLEPIVVDIRARVGQDAAWERIGAGAEERLLPADALAAEAAHATDRAPAGSGPARVQAPAPPPTRASAREAPGRRTAASVPEAPAIDPRLAAWREALDSPIEAFGLDLGPPLAAEVAAVASRWLPGMTSAVDRIERFIERIRPAGIVLADEYHRQDWMAAARAAGVPVAAVQHGMIYPFHKGYIHAARPDSLRLPQRTFVFGRWERDLLRRSSVYRDDEVIVGGSPRLDLVVPDPDAGARIRQELGVGEDERLVVVSGTWGGLYRRFHYPIALAALVDRPLPGVHLVVKLHPGEPDEGPYRQIVEGAAAARGFAPPKVTTVQSIDLYRLLAAADAHLGIHSTVLTEAVVTRTPNLLADGLAGADLLGYVAAGVALPVRDGAGLLAALDAAAAGALSEADAAAFTAAHFEPGPASERIAANLEAWLR